MNGLMSAMKVRTFDRLLKAYQAGGTVFHDAIDGGAGSGKTAQEMLGYMSADSTVYAFEPFPGNHRFFANCDSRIKLIPKALAEISKEMSFLVTSTVNTDSVWGRRGMEGYSSVGKLIDGAGQPGKILSVECTRADNEIPKISKIGFIKLDLQGGELNALKGCTEFLSSVAVMWVEYSGQAGLMDFLHDNDFMAFDTEYMFSGTPSPEARNTFDVSRKDVILSNDVMAWFGFRKSSWLSYEADLMRFKKAFRLIQTDLVCVNKRHLSKFIAALPHL